MTRITATSSLSQRTNACAIRLFPWIQEEGGRVKVRPSNNKIAKTNCTRVRSLPFSRPDWNHWWYRHTFLCLFTCCSRYFPFSCSISENASICVHLLLPPCVHPGTVVQTKTHKPSPSLPLSTVLRAIPSSFMVENSVFTLGRESIILFLPRPSIYLAHIIGSVSLVSWLEDLSAFNQVAVEKCP